MNVSVYCMLNRCLIFILMMIFVFSMGGFKVMLLSREGLWENIAFLAVALAWAGSCKFPIHHLFILFFPYHWP